jgi:hypothetical protein
MCVILCTQDKMGREGHIYIPVFVCPAQECIPAPPRCFAGKQQDFRIFPNNLAQLDKIVGFARNLEILLHSYAALMLLMDFQ